MPNKVASGDTKSEEKVIDLTVPIISHNVKYDISDIETGKDRNDFGATVEMDENIINLEFLRLDETCDVNINGIERNISSDIIKSEEVLEEFER